MDRAVSSTAVVMLILVGIATAQTGRPETAVPADTATTAGSVEDQPVLAPKPKDAGTLPRMPGGFDGMLNVIGSLTIVIALVALIVWGLKRFAPRAVRMYSSESLRVLSRTFVGPKQMVCLLKAPGRLLIVGSTQQTVTLLSEITDPAEIERIAGLYESTSPKGASAAFREIIAGVGVGRKKDQATEQDLAAAVNSVSDRFASLTKKMEGRS